MTTSIAAATVTPGRDPADYDDDALDRLAELIADRVAARLGGLTPGRAQPEPLVDAAEIMRCAAARTSARGSKRSSKATIGHTIGHKTAETASARLEQRRRLRSRKPRVSRAF